MTRRLILALPVALALTLLPPLLTQGRAQQVNPDFDDFSRRLLGDVQRAGQDLASEGLAQWIIASHADALRDGVSPIPALVRAQLEGHFPAALLDRVRYRVGSANQYGLAANAFNNRAAAITLDDVVLFRDAEDAAQDAHLWAHELTHVQQYERWGVRGFARRYTLDHRGVEAEATARATQFAEAKGPASASGAR